jgi:hypothetical protein
LETVLYEFLSDAFGGMSRQQFRRFHPGI